MVNDDREEEGRVCTILLHAIRKSPKPSENRLTAILNLNKPKSAPSFEPGQVGQNAFAPPLSPPKQLKNEFIAFLRLGQLLSLNLCW